MIEIKNLKAKVEDHDILKGVDLKIGAGEVHAIMGPNGSGKSTLASVLSGNESYEVTGGDVLLEGESIMELSAEERALAGIFLAFQYPVEIPGVNNIYFMRASLNAHRKHRGLDELDAGEFMTLAKTKMQALDMDEKFIERSVNDGFSGGEKKRNEIFQMSMLEPKFAVLDETDSGLDIDAIKVVAKGVNALRDGKRSFLLVTHYQRLLNYIEPDFVHVMSDGKIVKSGDKSLALELEDKGYDWIKGASV